MLYLQHLQVTLGSNRSFYNLYQKVNQKLLQLSKQNIK